MVYAQSPSLGLTVWLVSGNGAVPRAAAMVEIESSSAMRRNAEQSHSTGNRGTGLSPGAWKVDGGLKYLGAEVTDASMDIDILAIDDYTLVFNILDSSIVNGSSVIPGGYQGLAATYKRHNFGWFDNRNGYYLAQSICVVNGQCLTEGFFEENQNKLMVYANSPSLGLTVWVVSGNGAVPRAAAMVETESSGALRRTAEQSRSTGNRGTGLSPGAWRVDGGLKYLGTQLTDASMDLDIVAIDDNTLVFNVLDSSIVNGSNVIPGGYQGLAATYKRHNFGWFDDRNGYYLAISICLVNGQCMTEAFVQENQNKMMVYAQSPTLGLTVWLVSGNGAVPRAAAMVETDRCFERFGTDERQCGASDYCQWYNAADGRGRCGMPERQEAA